MTTKSSKNDEFLVQMQDFAKPKQENLVKKNKKVQHLAKKDS